MANKAFYSSEEYRRKQSERTKQSWQKGQMDFMRKKEKHSCARKHCKNTFETIPSDPKRFCSQSCSTTQANLGSTQSKATRNKISQSLTGKKYPDRPKAPPRHAICLNCKKNFTFAYWRPANNPLKYCGRACAIKDIGSRPTSPRAARAKAGIRRDIDPEIYFFSRWEANYARLLTFLGKKWQHQPKTFQLKSQRYTPDFYLPGSRTYVEIKNYLSTYSKKRDQEFRELYPDLKLLLILKKDYLVLQEKYASKIKNWEYKNSLFD